MITYKFIEIDSEKSPHVFFNWCLEKKLYKASKDEGFLSYLKVIYENCVEKFNGCLAFIAFDEDKPIGICLLKKRNSQGFNEVAPGDILDKKMLNNEIKDMIVHKMGRLYQDNRYRRNKWKTKYDDKFVLHAGFVMFYVKPRYRKMGIATHMLKLLETCLIKKMEGLDKNKEYFLSVTAREKAFDLIEKKSLILNVTDKDLYGLEKFISNLTYRRVFEDEHCKKINIENSSGLTLELDILSDINESKIKYSI